MSVYNSPLRSLPWAETREDDALRFKGLLCPVPSSGTYSYELQLGTAARLQGADYWVSGAALGDSVSFSVIANGTPIEYVTDMPLAPFDYSGALVAPTVATLPASSLLRVTIAKSVDAPMSLGVTFRLYEASV